MSRHSVSFSQWYHGLVEHIHSTCVYYPLFQIFSVKLEHKLKGRRSRARGNHVHSLQQWKFFRWFSRYSPFRDDSHHSRKGPTIECEQLCVKVETLPDSMLIAQFSSGGPLIAHFAFHWFGTWKTSTINNCMRTKMLTRYDVTSGESMNYVTSNTKWCDSVWRHQHSEISFLLNCHCGVNNIWKLSRFIAFS